MKNIKIPTFLKNDIKIKLIVCVFLSVFMSVGYSINQGRCFTFALILVILIPVLFLVNWFLISLIYKFFDRLSNISVEYRFKNVFLLSFFLLMIFFTIEFLGFYPGMFNYDAYDQLQMYLNNNISEWHPVLHTMLIGKIIEFSYGHGMDVQNGIAIYTVIQYTVTALCFAYSLNYVYKKCNLKIWLVTTIFLSVFPTITLQIMSATKDSYFLAFFVLSMTLTVECIMDFEDFKKSLSKQIILVLSLLFILIFRNNCIYAFPVLCLAMLCAAKDKKRIIILLSTVVLLFVGYKTLYVRSIITVNVDSREMLSVPSQQLARIYMTDDSDLSEEDRIVIENFIGYGLEDCIPSSADIVKYSLNMNYYAENRSVIMNTWFRSVVHNPGMAIMSFADLNCGFWYPLYDLTVCYDGEKGYWEVWSKYPFYIEPKIRPLWDFYQFFLNTDFSNIFLIPVYLLFAPATFFYIFVIMFGYSLKTKSASFNSIFSFCLVYWCTFLLGPVVLVRYVTFLYAIVPLYFILIFKKEKNNEQR